MIGAAIAIGIVVTCIVPLFVYIHAVSSLYDEQVAERHIRDKERMDERLQAGVYEDFYAATHGLYLRMYNPGYLAVKVVRVWVTTRDDPLKPAIEVSLTLPPRGDLVEVSTGVKAEPGVVYDVRIVSDRGNIYVPDGSPIKGGELNKFPYTITVTIVNMHDGWLYRLDIKAVGVGEWVPHYLPKTLTWKGTSSNPNQSLCFGVNPGIYNVTITREVTPGPGKPAPGWTDYEVVEVIPGVTGNPTVVWDCAAYEEGGAQ